MLSAVPVAQVLHCGQEMFLVALYSLVSLVPDRRDVNLLVLVHHSFAVSVCSSDGVALPMFRIPWRLQRYRSAVVGSVRSP